jgi:hypothetical protein
LATIIQIGGRRSALRRIRNQQVVGSNPNERLGQKFHIRPDIQSDAAKLPSINKNPALYPWRTLTTLDERIDSSQ